MSAVHSGGRSSRAVHVVLASLLLAACEGGDLLDQRPLVGEWHARLDDGTHYTMTLEPDGDGATTVTGRTGRDGAVMPARDTIRFEIWWYGHDSAADSTIDSTNSARDSARDSSAAGTVPTLCLMRDEHTIRCHVVHAVRGDTLDMTEDGGRRLLLSRAARRIAP